MNPYAEPKIKSPDLKIFCFFQKKGFWLGVLLIFLSTSFGFLAGLISSHLYYSNVKDYLFNLSSSFPLGERVESELFFQETQEEAIVKAVEAISPSVVSIVITKDVPVLKQGGYLFEEFFGFPQSETRKEEVGGGSGFLVSEDGLVLTNKHVIRDLEADYTVLTNDGKSYPAKVLARDPVEDIALLKIEKVKDFAFLSVKFADSDQLRVGQTVIAIGNALGEYRNTVSVGVISGLGRTITASGGGGLIEILEDVIQTDAAINQGNSGGPLLNIKGEVVGINTAMVSQAQSIGFALPSNKAVKDIEQVKLLGKIIYPFLGVRYVLLNEAIQEENGLAVAYGAWIKKGNKGEEAITPGSAAEKAGLRESDIILEINQEKITSQNTLAKLLTKYQPGNKIILKVLRGGKEEKIEVTLGEREAE